MVVIIPKLLLHVISAKSSSQSVIVIDASGVLASEVDERFGDSPQGT